MSNNWSEITDYGTVKKRAGGRRHYNMIRRFLSEQRKCNVAMLYSQGLNQSEIARRLGVHRSTVCRDIKSLFDTLHEWKNCPVCGHEFRPDVIRLPPGNEKMMELLALPDGG